MQSYQVVACKPPHCHFALGLASLCVPAPAGLGQSVLVTCGGASSTRMTMGNWSLSPLVQKTYNVISLQGTRVV
jgi:hypothetical protein